MLSFSPDALRGLAMHVRARIGRGTSAQGFYALQLRYRDLAFDVGANTGDHTRFMLKRGARVVAVEPQPELAAHLAQTFPGVEVMPAAVGDAPGQARLLTAEGSDRLTTLNPDWTQVDQRFSWHEGEFVEVTTLDALIARFGVPALVKIDTEGLEDRVLAGLSRPVKHILFEVHHGLGDVASRAFDLLEALGRYEYRVMEEESWSFGEPMTREAILERLPEWGDVHARLTAPATAASSSRASTTRGS